jgi:hypothetical protein
MLIQIFPHEDTGNGIGNLMIILLKYHHINISYENESFDSTIQVQGICLHHSHRVMFVLNTSFFL